MGASMKCDKKSLALLSSKKSKAYTRSRADEAFALPSFLDPMPTAPTRVKVDDPYSLDTISGSSSVKGRGGDVAAMSPSVSHAMPAASCRTKGDNSLPSFSDAMPQASAKARDMPSPVASTFPTMVKGDMTVPGVRTTGDMNAMTTRATVDQAFTLPSFSDALPPTTFKAKGDDVTPSTVSPLSGASPVVTSRMELLSNMVSRPEHHRSENNVEKVKQTMLEHESVFKEQLYELHRLYQVQRSLMAESERKGPSIFPHSDPPSSNSSLLYDPESGKDANNSSKVSVSRQLYFPGQIDVNKPCEGSEQATVPDGTPKQKDRPVFDLELPAEEYMDEVVEMKTLPSQSRTLQSNVLQPEKDKVGMALKEAFGSNSHNTNEHWGQNQFMFNLSENKLSMSSRTAEFPFQHSLTMSSSKPAPVQKNTVEENIQKQSFDIVLGQSNTQGNSKLPHWLLQAPSSSSKSNSRSSNIFTGQPTVPSITSKLNAASQSRNGFPVPGERIESSQDISNSPSLGGKTVKQGQVLQTEVPRTHLNGIFQNMTVSNGNNLHNMAQVMNDNVHLPIYLRNDRNTWNLPAQVDVRTNVFETHTNSNMYSPVLSIIEKAGIGGKNDTSVPLWYEQKGSSSIVQQFGSPNQRSLYSSSNLFHPNTNEIQSTISYNEQRRNAFTTPKADDIAKNLEILSQPPVTKQEVHAESGNKADVSRCDNLKQAFVSCMKTMEDTSIGGEGTHKHNKMEKSDTNKKEIFLFGQAVKTHDRADRLDVVRNNFDLNVQSCDDLPEKETPAYGSGESRMDQSPGWCSRIESKASYTEDRNVKGTDVDRDRGASDIVSAVTHLQHGSTIFSKDALCFYSDNDAGGHFTRGRSSDGSGLTSCESREAATIPLVKSRDDSNTSSGDQSGESGVPCQSVLMAFSSNVQSERSAGLHSEGTCGMHDSVLHSNALLTFQHNRNEEVSCTDMLTAHMDHENTSSSCKSDAWEAASSLLSLGFHDTSMYIENDTVHPEERSLKWFADVIRQEENHALIGIADESPLSMKDGTAKSPELTLFELGEQEKELDSFETAILMLKPVDPSAMKLCSPPVEIPEPKEESPPIQTLRRRSSRRGKANKDFQKDLLPSMASLSRQEVAEDLQIIEGLIKSATETTGRALPSPREEGSFTSKPEQNLTINNNKIKGNKASYRVGKQKGTLRVYSWGESTRRKRMRRQRSQWLCLPPGV